MFLCETKKGLNEMKALEQRRKQLSLVRDTRLDWSRKVPDRKGIWLRLSFDRNIVAHRVTVVNRTSSGPGLRGSILMIDWGIGDQFGLMLITPISIRIKLRGWLWCGPIPFYPPNSLPMHLGISMELPE